MKNGTWQLILKWNGSSWENRSKITKIFNQRDETIRRCTLIYIELLERIWFESYGISSGSKLSCGKVNPEIANTGLGLKEGLGSESKIWLRFTKK